MNDELNYVAEQIGRIVYPEDLFGVIGTATDSVAEKTRNLGKAYKRLARFVHEDRYPDPADRAVAHNAFIQLSKLHQRAEDRLKHNVYGDRSKPIPVDDAAGDAPVVIKGKYTRYASFTAGDIADLHSAFYEKGGRRVEVLLKIAREFADNELLEVERNNLEDLHDKFETRPSGPSVWTQALPQLVESLQVDDGKGRKRRMNVLEKFDGFYSVEQIRALLPNGVDGRTVAWMWKRLVLLIDWTYRLGYLHGAVLPPHVMFYPDNDGATVRDIRKHSIRVVDWCYSRKLGPGVRLLAWVPQYEKLYAPEVRKKGNLGPWTDLYMGAKTMLYLVGGDPATNTFPAHIPAEIASSMRQCLEVDPRRRPQDPQAYMEDFTRVLKGVYGPPKYHDFILPR